MKHLKLSILASVAILSTSCASFQLQFVPQLQGANRVLVGMGAGAALGAGGGAVFSPNDESRALNALVFGLSGALIGGVAALVTDQPQTHPEDQSLRDRELGLKPGSRQFQVETSGSLPPFVRDRIQPAVIEEYTESDRVSEDGELHEPHRVYRIKRPVELNPRRKQEATR